MNDFNTPATQESITKTIAALKENGIEAVLVEDGEEAKKKALELIPKGAEVMTMTSVTLDTLGISKEINESGKFNSVRAQFAKLDPKTEGKRMKQLGAAADIAIGSVHAVTEDGHVLIASASGSQLPAYVYGAGKVIWVVGAQKIVTNIDMGMKRIYQHTLPLESERARKAYGVAGSSVNKMLILNKEAEPGRITMVIVNEVIGF